MVDSIKGFINYRNMSLNEGLRQGALRGMNSNSFILDSDRTYNKTIVILQV